MAKWTNRTVEEAIAEAIDVQRDHRRRELNGFVRFLSSVVGLLPEPWQLSGWFGSAEGTQLELKRRLSTLEIGPQLSQITWGIPSPSIERDFSVAKDFWNSVWVNTGPCPAEAVPIFANREFWHHFNDHTESKHLLLRWWTNLEVNYARRSFHVHDSGDFISALEIFIDLGGEQYAAMPMAYVWQFLRAIDEHEKKGWYKNAVNASGLLFFVRSEVTGEMCQVTFRGRNEERVCVLEARTVGDRLRYGSIGVVSPGRF